jgi:hypothetical protein
MLIKMNADHMTDTAKYTGGNHYNVSEELGAELIESGKAVGVVQGPKVESADARPQMSKPKAPKKAKK